MAQIHKKPEKKFWDFSREKARELVHVIGRAAGCVAYARGSRVSKYARTCTDWTLCEGT